MAYFSKSFLQDALQRRDDRGSQTEKQQDGHNALRRPDITGHQCSSPTSYIYYAEPVIEPVISLCRAGHRTSLAMFLLSCQLMPFMNFLHQCPCILVSSPSACVKLQMQSSCTGEDTSGAYSGAIHPRATYLGSGREDVEVQIPMPNLHCCQSYSSSLSSMSMSSTKFKCIEGGLPHKAVLLPDHCTTTVRGILESINRRSCEAEMPWTIPTIYSTSGIKASE